MKKERIRQRDEGGKGNKRRQEKKRRRRERKVRKVGREMDKTEIRGEEGERGAWKGGDQGE